MKKLILCSLFLTFAVAVFAQDHGGCANHPDYQGSSVNSTTVYQTQSKTNTLKLDFILFPNPTTETFALDAQSLDLGNALKINLYNLAGQHVRTFTVNKEATYQVGDLQDGMYLVQFLDAKGKTIATRKLNKTNAITRS